MATARALYAMVVRYRLASRQVQWHGRAAGRFKHTGILDLRIERRGNVAMWPSLYGCVHVGMVAELLLGHQTPSMRLRTSSGGLGYSGDLFIVHPRCLTAAISASECHPAIRTIPRGVLHREGDRYV